MLNTSFAYMILGLFTGLFYREFTKFHGFTQDTTLSVLHTHTLVLGMIMFLIVALFFISFDLQKNSKFKAFYFFYNFGLLSTLAMLSVRGVTQVLEVELSKGLNAAISGMSGLAHIFMTIGLFYLYSLLKSSTDKRKKKR